MERVCLNRGDSECNDCINRKRGSEQVERCKTERVKEKRDGGMKKG